MSNSSGWAVAWYDFDFDCIKPLLLEALDDNPNDIFIWDKVYNALTEASPSPPPSRIRWSSVIITRNTSSIRISSELPREVDQVLKEEPDLRIDVCRFRKSFFASVPRLEDAAEVVLRKCCEAEEPLFGQEGWVGWPVAAGEQDVLAWFCNVVPKLQSLAVDFTPATVTQRKLLAQPKTPLLGSTGRRSMDVRFVNGDVVRRLYAGDSVRSAYAREVLSAQDTRRFVLAFSLCGPLMRLWEYDRLGGIASEQFDINDSKGALEFVATMLGFLWMDEERLGFDPTIKTSDGQRFIEIERDGQPERLIVDEVIARCRCIAGRATTCWKAHLEDDPQTAFVIKDSWQYPEREDEGEILREVTKQGVINVARYYHHETVRIRDVDDDIRNSVRTGLEITTTVAPTATADAVTTPDSTATTVMANAMSISDATATADSIAITAVINEAEERPAKRWRSESQASVEKTPPNRIHRRIIVQDFGRPIYKASSPTALVAAVENCIQGHESLRKAGFLHRDISVHNVVIDERQGTPKGFLIDLDLAIRESREEASGAKGKTGTRAFMAIGLLFGEPHCFMHDLESIFWVLFWVCVNHDGPDRSVKKNPFDHWNYARDYDLAGSKLAVITDSFVFRKRAGECFTPFYEPLIPMMDRLRDVVFPGG
ncbi:serine/threonine-protein kinase Sgk2 [Trichoderma pleuroticola]